MRTSRCRRCAGRSGRGRWIRAALCAAVLLAGGDAGAQTISQRGFVEGTLFAFPQPASNDPTQVVGDVLARDEVFLKPAPWVQFAAGLDLRASTHDEVEDDWRLDFRDRGVRRPRVAVRRAEATLVRGPLSLDLGKQFIRWGKADIVNPTDHFAPRDYLTVVDSEFLAVTGAHGVFERGGETLELVWLPRFTPSRIPLPDQRWTVVPAAAAGLSVVDAGAALPAGSETGLRWSHLGAAFESSVSFFDGFNHLPNIDARAETQPPAIEIARLYPPIRSYGADAAVPTRWVTVKAEAAYFTSPSPSTDEYVLYVVQLERQTGEWMIVGGYAGEAVTARRAPLTFAPDRGMARSIVGRLSYTIDVNRSLAVETAVRQTGDGVYAKAEYSQAHGQHWRTTVTAAAIAGHSGDFLGQYHRNSHVAIAVRYSF